MSGAIGGGETYGDDRRNSVVKDVACNGTESRLLNCSFEMAGSDDCGALKDAHVVCQGEHSYRSIFITIILYEVILLILACIEWRMMQ